jgi:ComF family protein
MVHGISCWLQTALDFVFPAECEYCHGFLGDDRVVIFCKSCWNTIAFITEPGCPQCGRPYASEAVLRKIPHFICGECRTTQIFFDRVFAAAYYERVLKEAIHQFKFNQKTRLGNPLVQLLITRFPEEIDVRTYHAVLPVPLYKIRQRQRGYNQSAILAKSISQYYQIPLIVNNLIRIRNTDSQSLLKGRKERQENVKDAFRVTSPVSLRDKHIILVDDVLTTGATVNECSKTLKKAGVKFILVLTLSRPAFRSHIRPL